MNNDEIADRFEHLVRLEKRTTAEVIEYLKEIDRRKIYLERGHTSLFAYLTDGLGYTPSSAQRRINAARLMNAIPEIKADLRDGSLNLMQVSMLSQAVRQSEKPVSVEEKKEILETIKSKDLNETQKILCQKFDIELKSEEKVRIQKDESFRVELSFSKEQMEMLKRIKDLISHQNPNATWVEVIEAAGKEYIKRKDPLAKESTAKTKAAPDQVSKAEARRNVHRKDRCCQWIDPVTGKQCQSTFQSQIDHKQSRWAGGTDSPENFQLLCSIHNRLKYAREVGIKPV